ncbi:VOC family protein [Aquipuribacter hungaricus]|uniref:VOC family protein n=1 Tax=Aquipuribacter hungaricus TaxID=545624 RepID=A0ABV7WKZ7_9MICO
MPSITPCLWFDRDAERAAELYVSVFPRSEVLSVSRYGPGMPGPLQEGDALTVQVSLDGNAFTLLNGGPQFPHSEAVSFQIACADQEETDRYWDRLTADGGQESMCGWLKDPFGVSWQVVPTELPALLSDPVPARAQAATQAMLSMRRIVVADVLAAADAAAPPQG